MRSSVRESSYRSLLITDRNHPSIRPIRALHHRAGREESGRFFLEGLRFVHRAMAQSYCMERAVVAPSLLPGRTGSSLLRQLREAGAPITAVSLEVFHSLSLATEPQGIAVVARQRWTPIHRARAGEGLGWVAFERVGSAGNLGTAIRTAEAVGAAGVILIGDSIDPYDPATIRASMGGLFALQIVRATGRELLEWSKRQRCALVGASLEAADDYRAVPFPTPVVLVMGTERTGLSTECAAACDRLVRIPMTGRADSLNLGVAASILLYELYNQSVTRR